jgi:hypothetical protein
MSRWLVITLSAVVIVSALVIGITFVLLKNSETEEKAQDEIFLKQKADLLKLAVDSKMNNDTTDVSVQSGKILENVNSTKKEVNKSNSKLAGLIAKQKAAITALRKKYEREKNKVLNKA